jgi:hypothetical protein
MGEGGGGMHPLVEDSAQDDLPHAQRRAGRTAGPRYLGKPADVGVRPGGDGGEEPPEGAGGGGMALRRAQEGAERPHHHLHPVCGMRRNEVAGLERRGVDASGLCSHMQKGSPAGERERKRE